jgi:hypothetical protein
MFTVKAGDSTDGPAAGATVEPDEALALAEPVGWAPAVPLAVVVVEPGAPSALSPPQPDRANSAAATVTAAAVRLPVARGRRGSREVVVTVLLSSWVAR